MKLLIAAIIFVLSVPAEADLTDKVSAAYDKLLGQVSLVCEINEWARKRVHGFSPNSKYNVVIRTRWTGKIIAIERHANNYNYDESEGFVSLDVSDKYITFQSWHGYNTGRFEKPAIIKMDRYNGILSVDDGSKWCCLIIGECKQGSLKAKKQF